MLGVQTLSQRIHLKILTATSAVDLSQRRVWVVHAHLLAGAEWRLHDPQRPLTHDRLLYVIQRPFGRITSMPATGQKRP